MLDRRALLDAETGTLTPTGRYQIALMYPNPYRVAMSSLGYQLIYRDFNQHPDVGCERAVLPDDVAEHRRSGKPLLTLETGRPVGGADAIGISLAYEPDIHGLFDMLELARIPALRSERGHDYAPVILGGPITMSNALPLAPVADVVVMGDGEGVAPLLLDALLEEAARGRSWLLETLAAIPGLYVPELHGTAVPDMRVSDAAVLPARGQIWTPNTELSNMLLVEPSRGCPRFCSFCVMRSTAQPMRECSLESLAPLLATDAPRIGFVGAAISEYKHIRPALRMAVEAGKGVGISSLRADRLDDEFMELLVAGGYRTLTVASDAASQALRGKLKKGLRGRHLIEAAELGRKHGIKVLKVYVILGLPGETLEDIDELAEFSLQLQKIVPRVALGASPFVPKLHTPLGDAEFTPIKTCEKHIKHLRKKLQGRVEIRSVSPRWAWIEYRLSQGGPEAGLAALEAWKNGGRFADWKRAFDEMKSGERDALSHAAEHALWQPAGMR